MEDLFALTIINKNDEVVFKKFGLKDKVQDSFEILKENGQLEGYSIPKFGHAFISNVYVSFDGFLECGELVQYV